ncbi:autotransporter outer membrane beta-barrel domain-containing protein [Pandoraea apista]|nr:autotransporter outer membrane beta-barrel domain-containing protein [Pandoraea apista]
MLLSSHLLVKSYRHQRSLFSPDAWGFWLRAVFAALLLFAVSSPALGRQSCVLTWTLSPSELSGGQYTHSLSPDELSACDPGRGGLYVDPELDTNVTVRDSNDPGSTLATDATFYGDFLYFTPLTNTVSSAWSFTLYQIDGTTTVLLNIKRPPPAPTLSSVSSNYGPTAGDQLITLTGTNFAQGTVVKFGGAVATNLKVNSATSISLSTPAHAPGTVDIVVDTTATAGGGGGVATLPGAYTYGPPSVSALSPTSGPLGGGTSVVITGIGFSNVSQVSFGGTPATGFTVNSATQITATSPARGSAGTVDVTVTTPGGTSATTLGDQFTYVASPTVTSISPASGPLGGGTGVVITGTGFTNASQVSFGGAPATGFTVISATQITATSPARGSAGTVDVTVTTPTGTSATTLGDQFTYVAPPTVTSISPASGPAAGATQVTISGSGFTRATLVKFGSTSASGFTVNSDTSITVQAPAGAGIVDVTVVSPGGTSAIVGADKFTYIGAPTVTGVSPTSGPTLGNTAVTITGSGFTGATAVSFGGTAGLGYVVLSDTSISVHAPPGTGTVDVSVTTPGGTSGASPVSKYLYVATPSLTSVSPNTGLSSGGTSVTITGTGFVAGETTVAFGGAGATGVIVNSATSLTATTPAHAVGAVPVLVSTPGGTATLTNGYSFAPAPIGFVTSTLPGTVAGTPGYSQQIQVAGGVAPYQFSISSGVLPTGFTLDSSGNITGRATAAGNFSFVVLAKDASNQTAAQTLSIQVAPPTLVLLPATLPNGTIGLSYSQSLTGSGGVPPYSYALHGALPVGMTFTNGTISGTPAQAGTFNFSITMTDSTTGTGAPFSTTTTFSLNISASAMSIGPVPLPTPVAGQAYRQTITASGGTLPYRFTVTNGALPAGLSLDPVSGLLAGTPLTTGVSTFTITATDASTGPGTPITASQSYTFNISNQIPSAPPVQVKGLSNAPLTIHATANAVGAPFSRVAIVAPPASGTAVVNGEDIVYTPAANTNGAVTFAYALTNATGTSAPIAVTVTVQAVPVTASGLQVRVSANETTNIDITSGATGGPFTGAAVLSVSPADAGTATIVSVPAAAPQSTDIQRTAVSAPTQYSMRFVPAATFAGVAVITYTLSNENATSAPGVLQVSVAPRKDPSTDPDVTGLIGAQVEAARRFATTQIGNYNQRLEALHGKGRAPSSNGLNVVLPSPERNRNVSRCQDIVGIAERDACLRGDASPLAQRKAKGLDVRDKSVGASGVGTGDSQVPDLPGDDARDDKRFAYWTAGSVDFGFANIAAQRSGFKFTTGGGTLGADYRFSDHFSLGAGVGYGHDSTDIGSSGTRNTGDSYSGALYASFRPIPTLFVDAVAGFGSLSFNSRRWVVDSNDFASGKRTGQQVFGSVSAGYEYRSEDWLFSPYGRMTASRSTLDQYSETGAGLNALTYFKQNVNTLSGTLGVRAGFSKATRIGIVSPYIRVELQHDFNGQSVAGLAYADIAGSGPVYFVSGSPYGSDRVQVGFGAKLRAGVLAFGLDYSVTTGMGGLQQGVRLTFTAPF